MDGKSHPAINASFLFSDDISRLRLVELVVLAPRTPDCEHISSSGMAPIYVLGAHDQCQYTGRKGNSVRGILFSKNERCPHPVNTMQVPLHGSRRRIFMSISVSRPAFPPSSHSPRERNSHMLSISARPAYSRSGCLSKSS